MPMTGLRQAGPWPTCASTPLMSAITAIEAPRPARAPAWAWLRPSLLDFLFVALLLWLIGYTATGGTAGLLQDAGTGYHIRVGDLILRTRAIPHTDVFSFTRAGQPWYAWEWLSGVLFAILNGLAGLKGVVLFSAALIAATVVTLVRHMVWRGANALVALFLAHIGIAVSSLHFLARPHLFTFFFLALSLFVIDMDRAAPSRRIYWLLPMTVLWVNLHGGFIALPASLACLATGYLVAAVRGAAGARASAKRYGLLFGACLLVSGLNPFGFTEHVHIARYMNAGWIRQLVLEFQPPKFDGAQGFYAEALVLGAAVLAFRLLTRGDFAHAFLIALWTHAALHSVRHLPLLAIVVLPLAATEAQDAWRHIVRNAPRGSIRATLASVAADHTPGLTRISILPLTAVAAIAATSAMPF